MRNGFICILLIWVCSAFAQGGYASLKPAQKVEELRRLASAQIDLKKLDDLLNALQDEDAKVRMQGLKAWTKVGDSYYYEFSFEAYYNNEDDAYKKRATAECSALRDDIVARLKLAAETGSEPIRLQALRALFSHEYRLSQICPPTFRCGTGIEETLGYHVEACLKDLASRHEELFKKLTDDADPNVVFGAICCLTENPWNGYGDKAAGYLARPEKEFKALGVWLLEEAPAQLNLKLLTPLLESRDEDLREMAEWYIRIPEKEAFALAQPAPGRPSRLRKKAINSLKWESEPQEKQFFYGLMKDPEPSIREMAFDRLMQSGGEDAKDFDLVKSALRDPSPQVQSRGLFYAVDLEMPEAFSLVKAALISANEDLRNVALWGSGRVEKPEDLTPEIIRAVELGASPVYMAHPAFDDPRFAPWLPKCLNSKNAGLRELAALYYKERPGNLDAKLQLAKDEDPEVAAWIVYYLGKERDPRVYDVLISILGSKNARLRRDAATALQGHGNPAAVPHLKKLLADADRDVRHAARTAIRALSGASASR